MVPQWRLPPVSANYPLSALALRQERAVQAAWTFVLRGWQIDGNENTDEAGATPPRPKSASPRSWFKDFRQAAKARGLPRFNLSFLPRRMFSLPVLPGRQGGDPCTLPITSMPRGTLVGNVTSLEEEKLQPPSGRGLCSRYGNTAQGARKGLPYTVRPRPSRQAARQTAAPR